MRDRTRFWGSIGATDAEIKKAIAGSHGHHPDVNPGDASAKRFQEIAAA
jgi:DnaJ-class molecular chaperone